MNMGIRSTKIESFEEFAEIKGLHSYEQRKFNMFIAWGTIILACTSLKATYTDYFMQVMTAMGIGVSMTIIILTAIKLAYRHHTLRKAFENGPHYKTEEV